MNEADHPISLGPATSNPLQVPGEYLWCAAPLFKGDRFYALVALWPQHTGMRGWIDGSRIGLMTSDTLDGVWTYHGTVITSADIGATSVFNPNVVFHDGTYYLFVTGMTWMGSDEATFRTQQIYALSSVDLCQWNALGDPILGPTAGEWDDSFVSNPSVCRIADNRWIMLYKSRTDSMMRWGGVALSNHPLGPWTKVRNGVLREGDIEDPFCWRQDDMFYSLWRDIAGRYSRTGSDVTILFESSNGMEWRLHDRPVFCNRTVRFRNETQQTMKRLERPAILQIGDRPVALFQAALPEEGPSFAICRPVELRQYR